MENKTETICGQRTELFRLGQVVATPGAQAALKQAGEDGRIFLDRHARGDWGEADAYDCKENNTALQTGERLHSAYRLQNGTRLWIITEAGRSATTLLLPEEY